MKARWFPRLLACVLVALLVWGGFYYWTNAGFTKWMGGGEFQEWRAAHLDHQPFYIKALEGRMVQGQEQWRVRLAPKPEHVKWSWKWFYCMTPDAYQKLVAVNVGQKGYRQIWTQSFTKDDGEKRFQVVFLHIADRG